MLNCGIYQYQYALSLKNSPNFGSVLIESTLIQLFSKKFPSSETDIFCHSFPSEVLFPQTKNVEFGEWHNILSERIGIIGLEQEWDEDEKDKFTIFSFLCFRSWWAGFGIETKTKSRQASGELQDAQTQKS